MKEIVEYLKTNLRIKVVVATFLLGLIIVALGYTYAFFQVQIEKKNAFTMIVTGLDYSLSSSSLNDQNQITIEPNMRKTFEVEVTNLNEVESHFQLYYFGNDSGDVTVSYLPSSVVNNKVGTLASKGKEKVTITIVNRGTHSETITLGIQGGLKDRELVLKQGKELTELSCSSSGSLYVDGSGANSPVLLEGQIPVIYDPSKSSWVKADPSKKWYDYNNQEWANVVTVREENRASYLCLEAGEEVFMNDINTMWVWIPRYEYQYTNLGSSYAGGTQEAPGEIKVHFLSGTTTTPSNSSIYRVHPAFTFGDLELEGLWFSKFELSTTDTNCNMNSSTSNCDKEMNDLQIKPGVISWENARVLTYFNSIRNMQLEYANTYGFSKMDSDIHMIKNSEWGSVAYLSQSKYGKYGNANYIGVDKEVRKNNCSLGLTGIGADNVLDDATTSTCDTNTYETVKGQAASTTGNITGIYDMSGGRNEVVMGVFMDSSRNLGSGYDAIHHSGFNGLVGNDIYTGGVSFPDAKYYQSYLNPSYSTDGMLTSTACGGGICYGDALSETAGYYGDDVWNVIKTHPWFVRGGQNDNSFLSGIFSFRNFWGFGYTNVSTRGVWVSLQ